MNKADLVKVIAHGTGHKQSACEAMVNAFTAEVMKAVSKGQKVSLVGFGSFTPLKRKARPGRNPSTGAKIKIPAKKVPKFVPGKEFRDKVR
jgi:DNA-binding protein HU-beta